MAILGDIDSAPHALRTETGAVESVCTDFGLQAGHTVVRSRSWIRWSSSLLVSVSMHAVAACMLLAGWTSPFRLLPPVAGRQSIELSAAWASSATSDAEPLEELPNEPLAIELAGEEAQAERDQLRETTQVAIASSLPRAWLETSKQVSGDARPRAPALPPRSTASQSLGQASLQTRRTARPVNSTPTAAAEVQITVTAAVPKTGDDAQSSPASRQQSGAQYDAPPQTVYNPSPTYPPQALAAGLTGRVLLKVTVASDGTVTAASVHRSSGVDSLDQAALETVRRWRFEVPRISGVASRRVIGVPINFELQGR